jgi:hypothetical protein
MKSDYDFYQFDFAECIVCHKEILVEVMQFGVSHIAGIFVTHKKCVLKSPTWKSFKKAKPDIAKRIEEWVLA